MLDTLRPHRAFHRIDAATRSFLTTSLALTVLAASAAMADGIPLDLETGFDDVPVSNMGASGENFPDHGIGAFRPAAAYNATDDEVLVVWAGSDDAGEGMEIWGQFLDTINGNQIGGDFKISSVPTATRTAEDPDVAWDSLRNRYLVVWSADAGGTGEYEIYGQLIEANGDESGVQDFRISWTGPDGDEDWDAKEPSVVYNPIEDEYVVAWSADASDHPSWADENELFAHRLSAGFPLVLVYTPIQLTDYGPSGDSHYDVGNPDLIHNPVANEYLVAAECEDTPLGSDLATPQVCARRMQGANAQPIGDLEQISYLSKMTTGGEQIGHARNPSVTYNPDADEYFFVWQGTGWSSTVSSGQGEVEIWGRRRTSGLDAVPFANERQLTEVLPDDSRLYGAVEPVVAWSETTEEYVLAFAADHLYDGEFEIRIALVAPNGRITPGTRPEGYKISSMGPSLMFGGMQSGYDAYWPAMVWSGDAYTVAWEGDDPTFGGDEEWEIHSQRVLAPGVVFADGFEDGSICAWLDGEEWQLNCL